MANNKKFAPIRPILSDLPSWVGDEVERERIAAYAIYEDMYFNVPNTFKLLQRGPDSNPIYVPSPKTIVETLHRYLAPKMQVVIDELSGEPDDQILGLGLLNDLFKRERFLSRFSSAKRFGIMRGDWAFHIVANDELAEGSRISILPLEPNKLFKIVDSENIDNVIGYHIATPVVVDNETRIRRLTYRKETNSGGPSKILVSEGLFKVDTWGGPGVEDGNPEKILMAEKALPDLIDQLPIYHFSNFSEAGDLWGSSELRGMEAILASVNQAITDEQLTLALEGLGTYTTTAGQPLNPTTGQPEPWNLGPGKVVELPAETSMDRLKGVSSVTPYQDHLAYLHARIDEAAGQPDVARGRVDVEVAESGIALTLRLAPLLAVAEEKELIVTDVLSNMLYDLRKWFVAYESQNVFDELRFVPQYGDKMPENKQKQFDNIMAMVQAKLIDGTTARGMLRKIGYEMPSDTDVMDGILAETEMMGRVQADAMGVRLDNELAAQADESEDEVVPA